MATFLIINTGGTIGMVETPKGLAPKAGVINDAIQNHAALSAWREHTLRWHHCDPLLDSSDLQPMHWFQIKETIQNHATVDGVLVIHGTDTLSYTAAALSYLMSDCNIPIVLTGSMLPILDASTDAINNLNLALTALTQKKNDVFVAVGTRLLPAALTTKYTTLSTAAFDAPAWQGNWPMREGRSFTFDRPWQSKQVAVFTLFPGFAPEQIERAIENGAQAVLINAFGNGNAPNSSEMINALQHARQKQVPVFLRSQCYTGRVNVGQYEASQLFKDADVISCGLMPFEAVLVKILLLINQFDDINTVKNGFKTPISREWETTNGSE